MLIIQLIILQCKKKSFRKEQKSFTVAFFNSLQDSVTPVILLTVSLLFSHLQGFRILSTLKRHDRHAFLRCSTCLLSRIRHVCSEYLHLLLEDAAVNEEEAPEKVPLH